MRVDFDRRLKLEFHGSKITSDDGFLAYRELDDALGLTEFTGDVFQDSRTGKNGRHGMTGSSASPFFDALAAMTTRTLPTVWDVIPPYDGSSAARRFERQAASTSQMGRFETQLLASDENFAALTELSGIWIEHVHDRRPPKMIILNMDPSVSPTHGDQEGTAYNGHFGCTRYHLCSCSTSSAIWNGVPCAPATYTAPMTGQAY